MFFWFTWYGNELGFLGSDFKAVAKRAEEQDSQTQIEQEGAIFDKTAYQSVSKCAQTGRVSKQSHQSEYSRDSHNVSENVVGRIAISVGKKSWV